MRPQCLGQTRILRNDDSPNEKNFQDLHIFKIERQTLLKTCHFFGTSILILLRSSHVRNGFAELL